MAVNRIDSIIAQAKQLTHEELTQLIEQAGELLESKQEQAPIPDYLAFFGAGKGSFASPEEVVRFIRKERNEWER